MENEFYDEARKCPQCNIVTYCDRCPICGKMLPRSAASAKFAKFSGYVAGEEGELLQTREKGSIRQHIEVATSKQSENPFEYAEHKEPEIKLHGTHTDPTHPYFQEGTGKPVTPKASVIAMIVGFTLIGCVIVVLFSILRYNDVNVGTVSSDVYLKEPIYEGMDEILGSNYRYDFGEEESLIEIQNVGNRSFFATLEFYNQDEIIGTVDEILIMPNEVCDLSGYTHGEATSYRFVDYKFYEINSTKPNLDFVINNLYGSISLYTTDDVNRQDLEILLPYLLEASSFDVYSEMFGLEVYVNDTNIYSVYIEENSKSAEVYELNDNQKVVDEFQIKIGDGSSFESGAAL